MIDDPDAFEETPDERLLRLERTVAEVVGNSGVTAALTPGRRQSDVGMVRLTGDKQRVLSLPLKLLDRLPFEDVELLSSAPGDDYALTLAVTVRLEQQERSTPERRAKLRHMLDREGLEDAEPG